jgi:diguanylate cyclase (GGDEF)-like protein/PAS domain S-box-containing protein
MLDEKDLHRFDLMDAVEEGVCFLTQEHRIFFMNTQIEELTGLSSRELLGRDFLSLFPEDEVSEVESAFEKAKAGARVRLNTRLVNPLRQREVPILLRTVRYSDPQATEVGIYAMMLDLTDLVEAVQAQEELKARNRTLEDLVVTCPLTGVYNRRYFDLRIAEEVGRSHRYNHGLGLAIVDCDNFKDINDQFGHQAGDEVLRAVAACLRDTVRSSDIVARYGGDEFILILPEIRIEGILPLAIRLRRKIENLQVETPRGMVGVTTSIGLSCIVPDSDKPGVEELFAQADDALYKAKEGGRNRIALFGHPLE